MKKNAFFTLWIVLIGSLSWLDMAWWWTAVAGGVAGFCFRPAQVTAFLLGFSAGTVLWGSLAYYINAANGGLLAGKIGNLFMGLTQAKLMWATGIVGGLLAGLGALSGTLLRDIFPQPIKR